MKLNRIIHKNDFDHRRKVIIFAKQQLRLYNKKIYWSCWAKGKHLYPFFAFSLSFVN